MKSPTDLQVMPSQNAKDKLMKRPKVDVTTRVSNLRKESSQRQFARLMQGVKLDRAAT